MSEVVIKVENISKQYRLGLVGTGTFYHDLNRWWHSVRGNEDPYLQIGDTNDRLAKGESDYIWSLKDINFEVKRGEVLGIIGKNGAGKSTLLKILSRVTQPTTGTIYAKGRISSLLEVGTGFHPELSGRENIFLNGAILGMTKTEIKSKFDEIVDFSGIGRYIDTPVKRYSSGMYVRLAFAVAAHLEPEILIVDEVLAVGDAEFQKKCLGKMKDVSGEGKTVLFVSHNLGAVKNLCTRGILLNNGKIALDSSVENIIDAYSGLDVENFAERTWNNSEEAPAFPDKVVRLQSIRVLNQDGLVKTVFDVKEPISVQVGYWVMEEKYSLDVHLYFRDNVGQTIFVAMSNRGSVQKGMKQPVGLYSATCTIPANFFNEGIIWVEYLICLNPHIGLNVCVDNAVCFDVIDDKNSNGARGNWNLPWPPAVVRPNLSWDVKQIERSNTV